MKLWEHALTYVLTHGGIIFNKIGQLLSQRGDLLSKEMRDGLKHLQSDIEINYSIDPNTINNIHILEFDPKPLKAGTVGSVYMCKYNNKPAILKLRHPGIVKHVYIAYYMMKTLCFPLKLFKLTSNVYDCLGDMVNSIFTQLDFTHEVRNALLWRKYLLNNNMKNVYVPEIYDFSRNYIVMEYIDDAREPIEQDIVGLIQIPILSIVHFRVMHLDLHPGNILFSKKYGVVYIDFGMCIDVDQQTLMWTKNVYRYLHRKETDNLTDLVFENFYKLDSLKPEIIDSAKKHFSRELLDVYTTKNTKIPLLSDLFKIYTTVSWHHNIPIVLEKNQTFLGAVQMELLPDYFFPNYSYHCNGRNFDMTDVKIMTLSPTIFWQEKMQNFESSRKLSTSA